MIMEIAESIFKFILASLNVCALAFTLILVSKWHRMENKLDDIEKEPTIYNFLTHEVYENDTWIHREIDLRWKLLVHLTPEQRESVPPANHSMNGGIYHERTTI